jgi:hypothetical protein
LNGKLYGDASLALEACRHMLLNKAAVKWDEGMWPHIARICPLPSFFKLAVTQYDRRSEGLGGGGDFVALPWHCESLNDLIDCDTPWPISLLILIKSR